MGKQTVIEILDYLGKGAGTPFIFYIVRSLLKRLQPHFETSMNNYSKIQEIKSNERIEKEKIKSNERIEKEKIKSHERIEIRKTKAARIKEKGTRL